MARHGLARVLIAGASLSALFVPHVGATVAGSRQDCTPSPKGLQSCTVDAAPGGLPVAVAGPRGDESTDDAPNFDVLADMLEALKVMQKDYFAAWVGTWPKSIDWTGAVMGTHVSGALRTFSEAITLLNSSMVADWKREENLIDGYFNQVVAYYFGENAFAIRQEAYDDILWVVLGWLEAIKFINTHTALHYSVHAQEAGSLLAPGLDAIESILANQTWHGNNWSSAFAHRSRVFWGLATKGWDTKLCGGGMTWNPQLLPYKNAITNELWISGSISMYLYFPGDTNPSPFSSKQENATQSNPTLDPALQMLPGARDPVFLQAAVDGYKWLVDSNMTDERGLYTDGFHISGYADPNNNNTKCDERDNTVLSYNQGVILTGLRGLWEATGAASYLVDGHQLIQNVINATGFDLIADKPVDDLSELELDELPPWHGLGRLGVMEDPCDSSGTCSQDGQTFKGIYFHHLTAFCEPLGTPIVGPGPPGREDDEDVAASTLAWLREWHDEACARYGGWLAQNAAAARGTRDADGKYGQWWTAGLLLARHPTGAAWPTMDSDGIDHAAPDAVDCRNYGVPNDTTWRRPDDPGIALQRQPHHGQQQKPMGGSGRRAVDAAAQDPNNRGRGRTVETQGGGLALMRAYWSIAQAPRAGPGR